ncbi:cobalamin biosynthesis protein [Pseudonocardia sp. GCM10023141]|uniref:cobalamin biosynthesis protein n=1 Tax=Pseudonocardia sp. GCM10023141 TaxID=3252653 RepID=UPI00361C8DA9
MHRGGMVVGIGARRGISTAEVTAALTLLTTAHGIDAADVRAYASVDGKAHEPGILAAIAPAELWTYPAAVLARVTVPHPDARVQAATGTPSVAEAAALHAAAELAGGGPVRLVVAKIVVGRVTVAVASG